MSQLWALLVAIEDHQQPDWLPVAGALTDSQNVFQYLADDMGVPEDHILQLHNSTATRSGTISAIHDHLIDNPTISKGDAILFYYAGYGSYMKAPTSKDAENDSNEMVEVILPYDEGATDTKTGSPICAIPDYTLAALFDLVAARHGNNITIILDCCSNEYVTSAKSVVISQGEALEVTPRSIDPRHLTPLALDLDRDIITQALSIRKPVVNGNARRGMLRALRPEHVLLTACRAKEQAQESDSFGGIFTTLWLRAMRSDLRPRTYTQVIRYISGELTHMSKAEGTPLEQHPQCEGVVRDRIVFEETMITTDHFDAKLSADSGEFEVEAGEIHGVEPGTEFVLYGSDGLSKEEQLGSAVATIKVERRTCTVRADWHVESPTNCSAYTATIVRKPVLNYILCVDPSPSEVDVSRSSTLRQLSKALSTAQRINKVTDEDESDLEVRVDAQGAITLHRQDVLMRDLPNPIPRIAGNDINSTNLNTVFCGIARFNFHLYLTNPAHPFANKITFDMLRFTRPASSSLSLLGTTGVSPLPKVSGHTPTIDQNKEYKVTDKDDYAIVLSNDTDVDLYVQAWYFDPDVYTVDVLYEPVSGAPPTLPGKGGTLQIGVSPQVSWPLTFFVPEEGEESTLFAKVFLTDRPVKVRCMEQAAIIGVDGGKDGNVQQGEVEIGGVWDTVLQPITVVRG